MAKSKSEVTQWLHTWLIAAPSAGWKMSSSFGLWCEGQVGLIGVVVCLLAADCRVPTITEYSSTFTCNQCIATVSLSLTVAAMLLPSCCIVEENSARSRFTTSSTDEDCSFTTHVTTAMILQLIRRSSSLAQG